MIAVSYDCFPHCFFPICKRQWLLRKIVRKTREWISSLRDRFLMPQYRTRKKRLIQNYCNTRIHKSFLVYVHQWFLQHLTNLNASATKQIGCELGQIKCQMWSEIEALKDVLSVQENQPQHEVIKLKSTASSSSLSSDFTEALSTTNPFPNNANAYSFRKASPNQSNQWRWQLNWMKNLLKSRRTDTVKPL